jgi:hypothetical protein
MRASVAEYLQQLLLPFFSFSHSVRCVLVCRCFNLHFLASMALSILIYIKICIASLVRYLLRSFASLSWVVCFLIVEP